MKLIKRSIPQTLFVLCPNLDHANGVKNGIMYALSNLLQECDIIMRKAPEIETVAKENEEEPTQYFVRARFTAKEKRPNLGIGGRWIDTNRSFYEEEIDYSPVIGGNK